MRRLPLPPLLLALLVVLPAGAGAPGCGSNSTSVTRAGGDGGEPPAAEPDPAPGGGGGELQLPDRDVDGIPDLVDNCRGRWNPFQLDADRDGAGDACDDRDDREPPPTPTPTPPSGPPPGELPNVILFLPDQLRPQAVGAYGNPVARTPNLDALAAAGVRFDAATVGLPGCTASRAALLTGRMPYAVRSSTPGWDWMQKNDLTLHPAEVTLAEELNPLGYTTAHVGSKWHLEKGRPGESCVEDRHGFAFFEGVNRHGLHEVTRYCDDDGVFHQVEGRWIADGTVDRALRFLEGHADEPFFLNLWLSPPHAPRDLTWGDPHPPAQVFPPERRDLLDLFAGASIPLRPNVPGHLAAFAESQLRRYHAMSTGVDDALGRVLAAVAALGIDDRTIVIVSADHGSQLGSHAVDAGTPDGWEKNTIFDESILVPLIVYDPRQPPAGRVVETPVSLIDVLPTVLDLVGGPPPTRAQGRSFAPLVTGRGDYEARDATLVQFNTTEVGGRTYGRSRVLRTRDWKYAVFETGPGSRRYLPAALYDLDADPYEQRNLLLRPLQQGRRAELHRRLLEEMERLEDPILDEGVRGL